MNARVRLLNGQVQQSGLVLQAEFAALRLQDYQAGHLQQQGQYYQAGQAIAVANDQMPPLEPVSPEEVEKKEVEEMKDAQEPTILDGGHNNNHDDSNNAPEVDDKRRVNRQSAKPEPGAAQQ